MENKKQEVNLDPKSKAFEIWSKIKDKEINMFGLPNQTVESFVFPKMVEPSRLYVSLRASAVLPALEELLGKKYQIETTEKYTIISEVVEY